MHILGYTDLPSRLAPTASFLYGNNLGHLLADMGGGAELPRRSSNDEVVRGALVLLDGEVMWPPPRREPPPVPAAPRRETRPRLRPRRPTKPRAEASRRGHRDRPRCSAAAAFVGLGLVAPPSFLAHLTVFALACVVGWQVVWNVTPAPCTRR